MTSHKILFLVPHHPDYSNLEHASLSTLLLCVLYLCCVCLVAQQVRTLCHPTDCRLPGSSCQLNSLEWVAMPSSRRSSQPRDQIQVSRNAGRFFTVWATREAHEYWMGSLSLLQGIFPTQELNWGLRYCRKILYQLSYQGSPNIFLYLNLIQHNHYFYCTSVN